MINNFIHANIISQDNWLHIENYMKHYLNIDIIFVSFCEMYFKNREVLNKDWIGIIHDPPNTSDFWKKRDFFKNKYFIQSLKYCRGLFCMSESLKEKYINYFKPKYFVEVLHHPLPLKNINSWDYNKYTKNKTLYQIGNWLRKTYFIFQLKNKEIEKYIIPFNNRTIKELKYFLKKDNITLSDLEFKSVKTKKYLSNTEYENLFSHSIIVCNFYASTANNVILECIKGNTPILVNRLPEIEYYLGNKYPFYYNTIEEAEKKLENDNLILETHTYLKNMDKTNLDINVFISKIQKKVKSLNN